MFISTTLIFALSITLPFSRGLTQKDSVSVQKGKPGINRRHSAGSSLSLSGNLGPGDPVWFFQLNYGYRLTEKDNILLKL